MNKREQDYQRTKQELREALSRLVAKSPENIELKQRLLSGKVIKINNANVEKEAGKANQALKHHPDVKEEIETEESKRLFGSVNTEPVGSIKDDPLYKQQKQRLDNALTAKKKLNEEKSELQDEVARKDELLKLHVTKMDEIMAAMWDAIPAEEIENRTTSAKQIANILYIKEP